MRISPSPSRNAAKVKLSERFAVAGCLEQSEQPEQPEQSEQYEQREQREQLTQFLQFSRLSRAFCAASFEPQYSTEQRLPLASSIHVFTVSFLALRLG